MHAKSCPLVTLSPLTHLTALFGFLNLNTDSNLTQSKYLLLCARNSSGERWKEGLTWSPREGKGGQAKGTMPVCAHYGLNPGVRL